MNQLIGKMLDNRYEILEVVGTGGMAVVYKARCHKLNRLVAIKVLKEDLARDAEFRRRFHDESQAVAMLSNPNIVGVYDVSSSDGLEYIVMELIDGITLKQYMQKKNFQLGWRESLHFITQIMKALSHAHSRGIIHRDIKPHNIMVLRDGSIKVADFGIARLIGAGQSTLTQEALGSVHYISPEQAKGSHIDARSDIYSAGVVLYEMITGRLPFEGDSAVSVAIQHINSVPLSPRELNEDIPEALEAITLRAMASDVDKRYPSADAMLVDLEQFRKNPDTSIEFPVDLTPVDKQPEPEGDTQVVPIAGAGEASWTVVKRDKKKTRATSYDDEDEQPRDWKPTAIAAGLVILAIIGIIFFLWNSFIKGIFFPEIPEIDAPLLIGEVYETLAENPLYAGITITVDEYVITDETEPGIVISQTPEEGTVIRGENPAMTVSVSAAEEGGVMPSVVGLEVRVAEFTMKGSDYRDLELVIEREEVYHDSVTKNYVISTQPAADEPITKGQTIVFTVSMGPEIQYVTVPSFEKMTVADLEKNMAQLNLIVGDIVERESDEGEPGTVIQQSVAVGEKIAEGSSINFVVVKAKDAPVDPTPGGTITKSKSYAVDLPSEPDVVKVVITVDGKEAFNNVVSTNMKTINPPLLGTGVQEVCVYIDGELVSSENVDFS